MWSWILVLSFSLSSFSFSGSDGRYPDGSGLFDGLVLPAVKGEGRSNADELLRLGNCVVVTSSSGTNLGVF
jgi:hypothetical protein